MLYLTVKNVKKNYCFKDSLEISLSNLLWITRIKSPKVIALIINKLFKPPLMENDILINMVEIINPELRITLWNSSVIKKEKRSKRTSATIKIVKNCSKKILLIFEKELNKFSLGKKIFKAQLETE